MSAALGLLLLSFAPAAMAQENESTAPLSGLTSSGWEPDSPAPVNLAPSLSLNYPHISGTPNNLTLSSDPGNPVKLIYGDEFIVQSDIVSGDLVSRNFFAKGNVRAQELDAVIAADVLSFQGSQHLGIGANALLYEYPIRLQAGTIDITPLEILATRASVATTPPGTRADLELRVAEISLYPQKRRGVLRNSSLYILHNRIFTVRYLAFHFGHKGKQQTQFPLRPGAGFGGRYGAFVTFSGELSPPYPMHYDFLLPTRQSPQVRLSSRQIVLPSLKQAHAGAFSAGKSQDYLGALRALANALEPPLPQGDPLLFHNFLPIPNEISLNSINPDRLTVSEELSSHVTTYGNRRNDLYVSRTPEVSIAGAVPLTPVAAWPKNRDPVAFRRALRHVTLWAEAQETMGVYREQPTNVRAGRQQMITRLTTDPILIAPNTLLQPNLTLVDNRYSGSMRHYGYDQMDIALNHYFSDRSGVGARYIVDRLHGSSPFNFDVPDTTRELDGLVQAGNYKLVVGGQIRYDLVRHSPFDYGIAVAPSMRGFSPVLSYSFRSRSLNLGIEIPGLTF